MLATRVRPGTGRPDGKAGRRAAAAVEFAFCLPVIATMMLGLWEIGRITEVQNVVWNSGREAARDASLGQQNFQTVTNNLLTYLQSAEPTAFGQGHSTSVISPVVSIPSGSTGYTCWDNTANRELFTVSFYDVTNPSITDPTAMKQLDHYQVVIQLPYAGIAWSPLPQITGTSRMYVTIDWVSMVDSPFQIAPNLPAQ